MKNMEAEEVPPTEAEEAQESRQSQRDSGAPPPRGSHSVGGWMNGWMAATLYMYSPISVGAKFRVEITKMGDYWFSSHFGLRKRHLRLQIDLMTLSNLKF